jgi:hypothetical protein
MVQLVSLEQMENTVRRMTARYTEAQMPTSQIDSYINLAYTLHFPEQFKNLKLTKPYVFNTVPNVDTYDFIYQSGTNFSPPITAPGNIQITPPVYCQGYLMRYYQDKTTFFNRWPKLSVNQIINTGTGINGTTYSGIIPGAPFLRAEVDIFGNVTVPNVVISCFDNSGFSFSLTDVPSNNSNTGLLVDDQGNSLGLINYFTGNYSFNLVTSALPLGATIYAAIVPYQGSRPIEALFYNQQIILRPVPLQVYQVEFQVSQQPTQLIQSGDAPELDEWYLFICAIAAKLIYTDFPDEAGMAYLMPIYQEQLQIAQRRTLRQMGSQRVQTIFSQPGRPYSSLFFGTEYSGTL